MLLTRPPCTRSHHQTYSRRFSHGLGGGGWLAAITAQGDPRSSAAPASLERAELSNLRQNRAGFISSRDQSVDRLFLAVIRASYLFKSKRSVKRKPSSASANMPLCFNCTIALSFLSYLKTTLRQYFYSVDSWNYQVGLSLKWVYVAVLGLIRPRLILLF